MGAGYHGGFGIAPKGVRETDFYVGENGQVMPAKYKHWIGVNQQARLLKKVKNIKLKKLIQDLYRRKSFIGDGGTASALKFEKRNRLLLSKSGHYIKSQEYKKSLERVMREQPLTEKERKIVRRLWKGLTRAILEWEGKI